MPSHTHTCHQCTLDSSQLIPTSLCPHLNTCRAHTLTGSIRHRGHPGTRFSVHTAQHRNSCPNPQMHTFPKSPCLQSPHSSWSLHLVSALLVADSWLREGPCLGPGPPCRLLINAFSPADCSAHPTPNHWLVHPLFLHLSLGKVALYTPAQHLWLPQLLPT